VTPAIQPTVRRSTARTLVRRRDAVQGEDLRPRPRWPQILRRCRSPSPPAGAGAGAPPGRRGGQDQPERRPGCRARKSSSSGTRSRRHVGVVQDEHDRLGPAVERGGQPVNSVAGRSARGPSGSASPTRPRAATTYDQNVPGSRSAASRLTHTGTPGTRPAASQVRSSVVFPAPAGAVTSVTCPCAAEASRSISLGRATTARPASGGSSLDSINWPLAAGWCWVSRCLAPDVSPSMVSPPSPNADSARQEDCVLARWVHSSAGLGDT
jgi:hypothetical protein